MTPADRPDDGAPDQQRRPERRPEALEATLEGAPTQAPLLVAGPDAAMRRGRVPRGLLWGGLLGAVSALLLVRPEIGGVSLLPPCPFKALTGWDCPLCGGTRAVRALLTGDVGTALDQNALVVVLALFGVVTAGVWLWRRRGAAPAGRPGAARSHIASRTLPVALLVLVAFAVVRNLPGVPYLQSGIG